MPANTSPIFTASPKISWVSSTVLTTVNTGTTSSVYDGTTNATLVFTAGSNGSFLQKLICEPAGTNAVSVVRIHLNNGSTNATASNNTLLMSYSLPSTTASNTTALAHIEIPIMLQIPPNYRVFASLGAAANLNAGWLISCVAGDY